MARLFEALLVSLNAKESHNLGALILGLTHTISNEQRQARPSVYP